jgi:hypothetical protein
MCEAPTLSAAQLAGWLAASELDPCDWRARRPRIDILTYAVAVAALYAAVLRRRSSIRTLSAAQLAGWLIACELDPYDW